MQVTGPVSQFTLTAASRQRILRQKNRILLKVRSNEAATLTVTGHIAVPGTDPKLTKVVAKLPAGRTVTVRIAVSRRALRVVRRTWARKKTATAVLQLRTRDAAGNTASATRRVGLRH
ncbi:MAG: hypothetical protein JHC95_15415 [Solirubrobacteraceae bacterium]|nr:hypothetical protein [Solirubrobacteraceae bacterium]